MSAVASEKLKPFILASSVSGNHIQIITNTKAKLSSAGFEIIGEHSPYKGATIIIITNDILKNNAKEIEFGYGIVNQHSFTKIYLLSTSFSNKFD